MACNRCGAETEWSTQLTPPQGVKKKDGSEYNGWWADKGKPTVAHICPEKSSVSGQGNSLNWSGDILLMNVVIHPTIDEAVNLTRQAIEKAEQMIGTLYQDNLPPSQMKGLIRNALTGHILQAQQNVILRDGLYKIEQFLSKAK